MEAIARIASGFAVVSLSIQLLEKIQELCDFWKKVKGAAQFIHDLVHKLRLLQDVIKEIHQKERQYGPDPALTSTLKSVSTQVDNLFTTMDKHQAGLSSDSRVLRSWTSFKFSMKSSQIIQIGMSLSETKATLVLAQFNLSEYVQASHV
jgi:hypothetical protein